MSTFSPVAFSIPLATVVAPEGMSDFESWRGAPRGTAAAGVAVEVPAAAASGAAGAAPPARAASDATAAVAVAAGAAGAAGPDKSNPRFARANNDDNCAA